MKINENYTINPTPKHIERISKILDKNNLIKEKKLKEIEYIHSILNNSTQPTLDDISKELFPKLNRLFKEFKHKEFQQLCLSHNYIDTSKKIDLIKNLIAEKFKSKIKAHGNIKNYDSFLEISDEITKHYTKRARILNNEINKINKDLRSPFELNEKLPKNSIIINGNTFQKMINELKQDPGNMAVLSVKIIEKKHDQKENEIILNDYQIMSPLKLGKYRMENDKPSIEIGISDKEYASCGYLAMLISFCSHGKYMHGGRKFFSQIVIENADQPSVCSGIIYSGSKFAPVHQIKITYDNSTREIGSPDLPSLKRKIEEQESKK
ncbi:MAG: hypothetical protein WC570_03830 [Patescibacteria group bacterium]